MHGNSSSGTVKVPPACFTVVVVVVVVVWGLAAQQQQKTVPLCKRHTVMLRDFAIQAYIRGCLTVPRA